MNDPTEVLAQCQYLMIRTNIEEMAALFNVTPAARDYEASRENCRALARLIMRALDDAGLAIVPKEPTDAMVRAGKANGLTVGGYYRAMIAAAKEGP